jgi:hypothetical protein
MSITGNGEKNNTTLVKNHPMVINSKIPYLQNVNSGFCGSLNP